MTFGDHWISHTVVPSGTYRRTVCIKLKPCICWVLHLEGNIQHAKPDRTRLCLSKIVVELQRLLKHLMRLSPIHCYMYNTAKPTKTKSNLINKYIRFLTAKLKLLIQSSRPVDVGCCQKSKTLHTQSTGILSTYPKNLGPDGF